MLNFLKQWELIFKISVNRNGKKFNVSRKKKQILTVNRKGLYSTGTLYIDESNEIAALKHT